MEEIFCSTSLPGRSEVPHSGEKKGRSVGQRKPSESSVQEIIELSWMKRTPDLRIRGKRAGRRKKILRSVLPRNFVQGDLFQDLLERRGLPEVFDMKYKKSRIHPQKIRVPALYLSAGIFYDNKQ